MNFLEDLDFWMFGVILFGSIVGIAVMVITSIKKAFFSAKKSFTETDHHSDEKENVEAVDAVVLSKRIDGEWTGGFQTPQYETGYFVSFLTDDGKTKEYRVGEELFQTITEGQSSTLVTVNGVFFGFGDGEEIQTEIRKEPTGD